MKGNRGGGVDLGEREGGVGLRGEEGGDVIYASRGGEKPNPVTGCLTPKRAENLVVVQSIRTGTSATPIWHCSCKFLGAFILSHDGRLATLVLMSVKDVAGVAATAAATAAAPETSWQQEEELSGQGGRSSKQKLIISLCPLLSGPPHSRRVLCSHINQGFQGHSSSEAPYSGDLNWWQADIETNHHSNKGTPFRVPTPRSKDRVPTSWP